VYRFKLFCGRALLSNGNGGATRDGEEVGKSVSRRRKRVPPFIGEEGAAPREVHRPLEVPPPPLHGGNPPNQMGNHLSNSLFNFA
jgi:hypothetical protein